MHCSRPATSTEQHQRRRGFPWRWTAQQVDLGPPVLSLSGRSRQRRRRYDSCGVAAPWTSVSSLFFSFSPIADGQQQSNRSTPATSSVSGDLGSDVELGDLVYKPPRNGATLWEIGVADRMAAEFYVPTPSPMFRVLDFEDEGPNK
nr:probable rhamnogalacturonate lyase B [Ipomoea batatas]